MEFDRDASSQEDNVMEVDNEDEVINWRLSQREPNNMASDEASEADITTVEFSEDGEMLALGDKAGRISILKRDEEYNATGARSSKYAVYSTFQSHEPEFDYLKSLEINEHINVIRWMKKKSSSDFILSTNDKTIKLWKLSERQQKITEGNFNVENVDGVRRRRAGGLVLPRLEPMDLLVEASPRRIYSNAHTYHINSISVNCDQETFISADDLRINLWHHEITNQSFTIVDIKPTNMEELTEVITTAEFHPKSEQLFCFGSSKGIIRLCDTRMAALCDRAARLFEEKEDPANRSFFSEIISSISDVKFSPQSGRYILTRDYLTVNVWDMNMENKPVETYHIHEYLRTKLCMLYENDSIFDKFECCWSGDDSHILTGSYNNFFRTFKRNSPIETTYEACWNLQTPPFQRQKKQPAESFSGKRRKEDIFVDHLDFSKKILHSAWHPTTNIVALAATNNLYIFEGSTQV